MPIKIREIAFPSIGTSVGRAVGRFLRGTRAGATSIVAGAVAVMSVAGFALIIDHGWLIDQRDVLKSAADAAAIAATKEMNRNLVPNPDMAQADLTTALTSVARSYVELNLAYLPTDRLTRAKETLAVTVTPDRNTGTVDVAATADLGGTLFSRHLPMLSNYTGPAHVGTRAGVETQVTPIEAVLAIDTSWSMDVKLDGRHVDKDKDETSRMDIVKDAAKALVNILRPNEHNRVAIGLVPWHLTVRLAAATASDWSTKRWARYPTERTYGMPYKCTESLSTCTPEAVKAELPDSAPEDWLGCVDGHRMGGSGTSAAAPAEAHLFTTPSTSAFSQAYYPAFYGAQYECTIWDGTIDDRGFPILPPDYLKHDCYNPYDPDDALLRDNPPQFGCSSTDPTILPLNTDRATIIGAIDSLTPVGHATHSALGVLWGQRMLLSSWRSVWGGTIHPVDPTLDSGKGVRKVIVLLTDGTDSVCNNDGEQCNDSEIGISRADACTLAKNAGIEIFVVAAMHPDQVSTDLGTALTECSSESDDSDGTYAFLNNATPESLQAVFESIANQLRIVRRVH